MIKAKSEADSAHWVNAEQPFLAPHVHHMFLFQEEVGTIADTKWKSPGVLCAALCTQHPPAVGKATLI